MIDITKLQMSSDAVSQKIVAEGDGSVTVPSFSGSGEAVEVVPIPHGAGTNEVIVDATSDASYSSGTRIPWASNDNKFIQYTKVDADNAYLVFLSNDSSGSGMPSITVNYTYRIIVP